MKLEPLNTIELELPVVSRALRLRGMLARTFRAQIANYLQVFAGTGVRLGLQAAYFFILANTLSLHDMGVFASTSATGIMIGCFSGLGFSSFAFRAAAGKRRVLGGYLAVFYVSWLISLPLCLAASLPVFYLLFTTSLSLTAFVVIILVEAGTWRIVEMIHQVNNGLGRYASASFVISLGTALRTAGAVAFVASGRHDIETWSGVYVIFNFAAMVLAVAIYQPRVRLRWRASLFLARIRDALMFAIAYCAFISQNEIDKVVMLSLADQRTVGIYAIASRIIDFASVPIRTFYVLYSRKLILEVRAQPDRPKPGRRNHDCIDFNRRLCRTAGDLVDLAAFARPQHRLRHAAAVRFARRAGVQEPAGVSLRAVFRLPANDDPRRSRNVAGRPQSPGARAAADLVRRHRRMGRLAQRHLYRPLRALSRDRLQARFRE
jgi:hypothetical protein